MFNSTDLVKAIRGTGCICGLPHLHVATMLDAGRRLDCKEAGAQYEQMEHRKWAGLEARHFV